MSGKIKCKEAWWNYTKSIIREYPILKKMIETPLEPNISGNPGTPYTIIGPGGQREMAVSFDGRRSGPPTSPVEQCVIHDLPRKLQRKFDAVENAISKTKKMHPTDYRPRLQIIDLVYFKGTHTIAGAALRVGCHPNTAGAWQAEFIRMVAEELDIP